MDISAAAPGVRLDATTDDASVRGDELPVGRRIWADTRSSAWFRLGLVGFASLVVLAFLYPWLSGVDPTSMHFRDKLLPPAFMDGGQWRYPLGTDQLGRDMLSRTLVGLQVSFLVGLGAVTLAFAVGSSVGLVAGFLGGRVDQLLMRLVDVQLSIPPIILAVTVLGVTRPTPTLIVAVLALASWPPYARLIRAVTLPERDREYVRAARVLGASDWRILALVIASAALPPVAFAAILDLARMMIFEAVLDFIGLGLQPPTPTLGVIIGDGRKYLINAWWVASLPGVFLMAMLLSINMMAVALERARNRVLGGLL